MSLPRYPEYKDSGVPWLGSVPTTWGIYRLKDVAEVINGYPFDSKLFEADGSYPLVRIRDLDAEVSATRYNGEFIQAAAVTSSDVLIGMDGDFNVGRWRGREVALLNQRMCCVRAKSDELSKFLLHALPIPLTAINNVTYSTTVKHLSSLDVEKIRFALPPQGAELFALAAFLDRETAKIDALVAEQEKLVVLLAEKRQATISHVVIRGLDPNIPMKESGITRLGAVPAHWVVKPLKAMFRQQKRQCFPGKTVLSVYRDFGVIRKDSRTDNFNKTPDDLSSYQLVETDDLVVNKMKGWQGSLGVSQIEGITSPDYMVFTPLHSETSEYLHLLLRSAPMVSIYRSISNGIRLAQWRLEPEAFLNLKVFLPPVEEQQTIAAFCRNEMSRLDMLTAKTEAALALLKERRRALIAAAVTGQIDVRGAVRQPTARVEAMTA